MRQGHANASGCSRRRLYRTDGVTTAKYLMTVGTEKGCNNESNQDRATAGQLCSRWRLYRTGGATTAKYLMSTSMIDNYQELLALNATENRGGAELRLMSLYPSETVLVGRNPRRICNIGTDDT
jgi:hypothetical protein